MAQLPEQHAELVRIWNILDRHKWWILGASAAVTILAVIISLFVTPVYRATATVLIESQSANVVSIEEIYSLDTRNDEYFQTQFEILKSRPIVENVIDALELNANPDFGSSSGDRGSSPVWMSWLSVRPAGRSGQTKPESLLDATKAYYEGLSIEPLRNTQLVNVHFASTNPSLSAQIANRHAEAYIDNIMDARAGLTDSAESWMLERVSSLQSALLESERRLQEYRESEQLIDAEGLKSLPAREINELSSRLVGVRGELSQTRIAYDQVYRGGSRPLEDLSGVPAILEDDGVRALQQVEAQAQSKVAELAKRYGPEHSTMIAAQTELAKASENLRAQRLLVAEAIRMEFQAAVAEEAELSRALDRAKQQYQAIGRKESELLELVRERDTNRELYELFYDRISETTIAGDLETPPARIISPAIIPVKPDKPRKGIIVSLSFAGSLILAVTAAFLLEGLSNSIRSAADVEHKLRLPVLGMLPLVKTRGRNANFLGNVYFKKTNPEFAEAVRTVRTAISLDNVQHPHKVIVIGSSTSAEGKSTVAMSLAYSFANSEKVLLVDADMRRPAIGSALSLPSGRPGLSELLGGKVTLDECVYRGGKGHMDVIGPGDIPRDPPELLSSEHLVNALLVLRQRYDRIIIDTPPVLPVSDGLLISIHADTVVFVVKADATPVRQINQSLDLLLRVNARVTGIVVNQLDTRKAAKYSDFGYGGYYETYAPKTVSS
jgi:capsular exopolysaccharide synthesis family protein